MGARKGAEKTGNDGANNSASRAAGHSAFRDSAHGQRPDPDALLATLQAQEQRAARGRLRIYFGASAGVGKTCAMLTAAHKLVLAGHSLLAGVVETHGRADTMALVAGLPLLPLKSVAYRGRVLPEFDLDAALAAAPALILIDELAHSNAPGSRHPKRWQDVEELLAAGIDVFTTVNVQHLDSLNDVIGGITGIRVGETVPDKVFDAADEVVLVDIPADELLDRLNSGKVYQTRQAERAAQNFFRKGNLIALRELALRRTADRVEDDVRAYRVEKSISAVWKTGASLLALVGPRDGGEHIVRSAARLAGQLGTDWHAIYVETPALQRLPAARRERILATLKLAEQLGAVTAVLSGSDIALATVDYVRSHNLSKVVLGRAHAGRPWRRSHASRIAALAPQQDLMEIGVAARGSAAPLRRGDAVGDATSNGASNGASAAPDVPAQEKSRRRAYLISALASIGTALAISPLTNWLDLANIAMLFLLMVVLVAMRYGRGPSVMATCIGVACFDFFFVPPRYNFEVSDLQYLITFVVMLLVGLVIGHLMSDLRFQAHVASHRERRARALYEFARELSGVLQVEQIFESTHTVIQSAFRARATLLLPDANGRLVLPGSHAVEAPDAPDAPGSGGTATAPATETETDMVPLQIDLGIAQWAFDRAQDAGLGTDTLPASPVFYLPLVAPMRTRGVLAIAPEQRRWILIPEQRQQLATFGALAAIALERVHYIEVAQGALVGMETERLRNSLLAALSHDLRTPLTTLTGLSESLIRAEPPLPAEQLDLAQCLLAEARRMSRLVVNLLDMARFESGEVRFNLQWQALEEVVGSALRASAGVLGQHHVSTRLPAELPLLSFDAVLIERVLCNLLENAAKYTPAGCAIVISAEVHGVWLRLTLADNGPGLPPGREEALFEKFTRGEQESARSGVGLGLAICRAIVNAHGGAITTASVPGGGAAFVIALPLGTAPPMPGVEGEQAGEIS